MTWRPEENGYAVYFNRDERRTRKPALPPEIRRKGPTRFIAPLDGDFGGTWIGVNEHGVSLALQNGYMDRDDLKREPADGFTSRGLLVTSLIDGRSAAQILRRLERQPLERFRSFHLAVFDRVEGGRLINWTGGRLTGGDALPASRPLVSSSYSAPEVCRSRIELFARVLDEPFADADGRHLAYHVAHRPDRGPFSPCMHRDDAHTVSFSRIRVDGPRIEFAYRGHSPCLGPDDTPTRTLGASDERTDAQ